MPEGSNSAQPDSEISLYALPRILLEYRYLILGMAVFGAGIGVISAFASPETYTAEARFMPQGASEAPALGGLAGSLGISIGGQSLSQSPDFYADLLGSREILSRILADTFTVVEEGPPSGSRTGTVPELFELEADSDLALREESRRLLRGAVTAETERGAVQFSVTTPWPDLSEAIARRLVELVEEFNVETRQSSAVAESRFLDERIADIETRLRAAEDDLRRFLETNRQFQNSPQLVFEHDRLQRRVSMHQQIYTSLLQSHEAAQSAAIRDTPLITVIEPPEPPAFRDPRRTILRFLLGLIIGTTLGMFVAFGRELLAPTPGVDLEFDRLREAWGETRADLRRVRIQIPGRIQAGRAGARADDERAG
ncbi:MAG: hypothetical protein GEU90_20745 [Gemmatimonas sp.]|nr:hypothetical protein [Gemmatimonas sp.]